MKSKANVNYICKRIFVAEYYLGSLTMFHFPPGHAHLLSARVGVVWVARVQDGCEVCMFQAWPRGLLLSLSTVILEVLWENGGVTSWERLAPESPLGGQPP